MKRHLILLFSALAAIATAQGVPHNMVSRNTPVNTNLIGAVVGEGLSLSNGVLSSTGGGGSGSLTTNDVRAIIEADAGPTNRIVKADGDGNVHVAGIFAGEEGAGTGGFAGDFNGTVDVYGGLYVFGEAYFNDEAAAVKSDIVAATNGMATAAEVAQLRTDASLVYQLLMGSNVVAEVTNYNSRVHAPAFRLLQLDPDTHEYITVWAETNGLTRTLNEAKAHTDAATNVLGLAKADRAWSHSTSGLGADAPAGVTWISTPETVIAGGYEYAKQVTTHGEVWVLTSNGMGFGGDTNSFFAVKSGDGETLFSIEKTDSVLVGVDADGISVSGGVVTIPIGVVSQDPPVCYAANSLVNATWTDLTQAPLPAWVTSATCTGTPGAWVWTIETTAPSAFFQFRVLQPGATVIRNNAQTDLSQGILVNGTRFYPHINGGTLTWTTTP